MKSPVLFLVAALSGAAAFFLTRASVREWLLGEEDRRLRACRPHYVYHLAVAKHFLEDSPRLEKVALDGGTAWLQGGPYPDPKQPPAAEDPHALLSRLQDKVLFLPRAAKQPDVSEDGRSLTVYYQTVTQFIQDRLLPGQSGEGFVVLGRIPEGKVLVLDPAASRQCAGALEGCRSYFWDRPAGESALPEGESPRAIRDLGQAVNMHRNTIEALEPTILAASAGCAALAFVVGLVAGLFAFRKWGAKPPGPATLTA